MFEKFFPHFYISNADCLYLLYILSIPASLLYTLFNVAFGTDDQFTEWLLNFEFVCFLSLNAVSFCCYSLKLLLVHYFRSQGFCNEHISHKLSLIGLLMCSVTAWLPRIAVFFYKDNLEVIYYMDVLVIGTMLYCWMFFIFEFRITSNITYTREDFRTIMFVIATHISLFHATLFIAVTREEESAREAIAFQQWLFFGLSTVTNVEAIQVVRGKFEMVRRVGELEDGNEPVEFLPKVDEPQKKVDLEEPPKVKVDFMDDDLLLDFLTPKGVPKEDFRKQRNHRLDLLLADDFLGQLTRIGDGDVALKLLIEKADEVWKVQV